MNEGLSDVLLNGLRHGESYWYLAGPYSGTHEQENARFIIHEQVTAYLLNRNVHVYSPIVHCYGMTRKYGLPRDARFWKEYNQTMIIPSAGLIVLKIPGWEESEGTQGEIIFAEPLGKKFLFITDDVARAWVP